MKQIDVNEVYILFEELKKQLKQVNENTPPSVQPQIEVPDLSVISDLEAKLDDVISDIHKPIKTEHHHIFSIASSKVLFGMIGLGILLLISSFSVYYQRREISTYKDNDLKYRYVKMLGETTPKKISTLENIFKNRRDSVKALRNQVKQYEKAIIEEAKRLEKARLKEQEAERLQREAESLKQQKKLPSTSVQRYRPRINQQDRTGRFLKKIFDFI